MPGWKHVGRWDLDIDLVGVEPSQHPIEACEGVTESRCGIGRLGWLERVRKFEKHDAFAVKHVQWPIQEQCRSGAAPTAFLVSFEPVEVYIYK